MPKLRIEVRDEFRPFVLSTKRRFAGVAHRRAGKTVAALQKLLLCGAAHKRPGPPGRYGFISPERVQAKDNAWLYLKDMTGDFLAEKSETELWVQLVSGARIGLYGIDNAKRMRGGYFDGVVLDEYSDWDPASWRAVVQPTLSDYDGWAAFIGTPKGDNDFREKFDAAGADPERWDRFFLPASQTGLIRPDLLAEARRELTEEEYAGEYECSFEAGIVGAILAKELNTARTEGHITRVPYDPSLPVYTGWDLGFGDATSIWFAQIVDREVRIIDWYENRGEGLDHYAKTLMARPYAYADHITPHDIAHGELGTGTTRKATLEGLLGREVRVLPRGNVNDRINAMRLLLARCWFDEERCKGGLDALRHYRRRWIPAMGVFSREPLHNDASHSADAFGYLAEGLPGVGRIEKARPASWSTKAFKQPKRRAAV